MKDYINDRLHSMNWWFNESHWGFDYNRMEFIEISDSIERDTIEGSNENNTDNEKIVNKDFGEGNTI